MKPPWWRRCDRCDQRSRVLYSTYYRKRRAAKLYPARVCAECIGGHQ